MNFVKNNHELGKVEILFIVLILIIVVGVGLFAWKTGKDKESQINSFSECAAAGNPVTQTYPEQCSANGKTFTNKESQSSAPQPSPDTTTSLFKVPELGVQFNSNDDLEGLYYYISPDNPDTAYFSLDQFKGTDCAADAVSLVALSKSTQEEIDANKTSEIASSSQDYKKIGNSYYSLESAQASCIEDQVASQKIEQVITALNKAVDTSLTAID